LIHTAQPQLGNSARENENQRNNGKRRHAQPS
jgi:hypothetical protein